MSLDADGTLTYASFSCDADETDSDAESVLRWNKASHRNYAAEPRQGSVSGANTDPHVFSAREAPAAQQPTFPRFDPNASVGPARPARETGYSTLDGRSHRQRDEVLTMAEKETAKRLWKQLIHGCSVVAPDHAIDGAASRTTSHGEPGEREALGGGSNHKSCLPGRRNVKPGERKAFGGGSNHKYRLGEAPVRSQRINSTGKSFAMQHHERNSSAYQQMTRAGVNEKNQRQDERSSEEMKGGVNAGFKRIWNPDPHKQWTHGVLAHADATLASLDASLANFMRQLRASEVPTRALELPDRHRDVQRPMSTSDISWYAI
jgi:hypothetical protein